MVKKSLKSQYLGDAHLRETLKKEYEVGSIVGMDSEFIVSYYQFVDTPEECYLTMDYVEGQTLDYLLHAEPSFFSQHNAHKLFYQLLQGMKVLHRHQVVHLDLKPSNIMLTRVTHDIRIIDLGFCYADAYQTSMGMTDKYAAPEQKDGSGEVDARTDIYLFGSILKYFVTELRDDSRWLRNKTTQTVIDRCLCENKDDRWQDIEEMEQFIIKHHRKHHRLVAAAVMAGFLLLLTGLYAIFQIPVTSTDHHALYGHFSLLKGTCEVVGKITEDAKDPYWEGNLYIFPEIAHWGRTFTVTGIADHAFKCDTTFQTVSLPSSLKRIGTSAFKQCYNLSAINIPDGVEKIGPLAFWKDTCLAHLRLPSSITKIESACFHHCAFPTVIIPEGVTAIDLDAFAVCEKLVEVKLPQSLTTLGRGVFWRCQSLEEISLPVGVTSIGEYCFMECTKLRKVENHATDPQPVMSLFSLDANPISLEVPLESVDKYSTAPEWNRLLITPLSY